MIQKQLSSSSHFNPKLESFVLFNRYCLFYIVGFDYYYGTKLRYISITINTTIFGPTLGYQEGIPLRDKWEDFFSKKVTIHMEAFCGARKIMEIFLLYRDIAVKK